MLNVGGSPPPPPRAKGCSNCLFFCFPTAYTKRWTYLLNAIVGPRKRGPWRGRGRMIHLLSKRSRGPCYASGAPLSNECWRSMNRVTTSFWWLCGNPGVELRYTM